MQDLKGNFFLNVRHIHPVSLNFLNAQHVWFPKRAKHQFCTFGVLQFASDTSLKVCITFNEITMLAKC